MNRAFGNRVSPALIAAVLAGVILLVAGRVAATRVPAADNALVAAIPEPNARLAAAPDHLTLTFAEPVAPDGVSVLVLRAGGVELPLEPPRVDPRHPARLIVQPREALGAGDFTLVWSTRPADGGALLAGAYPFRTGIVEIPGAALLDDAWPAPWATLLRWLVFLGTALAVGGFAWSPLLASRSGARRPGGRLRLAAMTAGALIALAATAVTPLMGQLLAEDGGARRRLASREAMPIGWWIQLAALAVLGLLALGALASGRSPARAPRALGRIAIGAGLAALAGLSLASHAAAPHDPPLLALEIIHQWTTLLWVSGVIYLAADWRDLGTDVSRFRTVRWIGGALFALSVVSGIARGWPLFPAAADLITSRYGQVLLAKAGLVIVVLAVGSLAMVVPRHSHAVRASRSLTAQSGFAVLAALLGALLALMAVPGTTAPATLAGVALADVVPADGAAFGADRVSMHLLTQPAAPGAQTLVVRLTDAAGSPLVPDVTPDVEVTWTPLSGATPSEATTTLQPHASGTLFTGAATLPASDWWQAEVTISPPGGVASRARFWLVLPDPNVSGGGPDPATDPAAQALFDRGLTSLTSLRSVRFTRRLGDGSGSLFRTRTSVSAAEGERPAAYDETVIDAAGGETARQIIVGNRRWVRDDGEWFAADPIPFLSPAAWGETYAAATGFQLGPREQVEGELSQIVTFWQPPQDSPSREPAWFAWWVGLASGQVRREVMASTRHYMIYDYSDFNAPIEITPPAPLPSLATPAGEATPLATPAGAVQLPVEE